jgi:hypothetical protein
MSEVSERLILRHLLVAFFALLILPTATSLSLREYPATGPPPACATRRRWWIFFAIKIALISVIVFCGSLTLSSIGLAPMQAHGSLIGYILAFRWALFDQRQRCPVCLRLLTNPTRIGQPSQTFLAWYGTELICEKGHGLLYVPEIASNCYSTQRWQYLDPSWSSLFS